MAIEFNTTFKLNADKCSFCGICVEHCLSNSLKQIGLHFSAEELVEQLLKDKEYYDTSSGGVTFSGGEPLIHIPYLTKVFKILKSNNINIAVQTFGQFNYSDFEENVQQFIYTSILT